MGYLFVELTKGCNLRCVYCYIDAEREHEGQ
jgi:MoaA/NifB/PqqE/SkfB family radical SAM enzyme